jgi:hypothetical protein
MKKRICRACKVELDICKFRFQTINNKRFYLLDCRSCESEDTKKRRKLRRSKIAAGEIVGKIKRKTTKSVTFKMPEDRLKCEKCGLLCDSKYCNSCAQKVGYLDKYPILYSILSSENIEYLKRNINANGYKVSVTCMKCRSIHDDIDMGALVKRLIKDNFYQCYKCSKIGKTEISVDDPSCINREETIARFGRMPVSVKKDKVVAVCGDCSHGFEVKASSILQQARRHKIRGEDIVYRCFACSCS